VGRLAVDSPAELWIKRDDEAGELYGGNKVRKLELLLGDALARKKKRVVTMGALGSHHALATTIYARKVGLEAVLVLYPQPLDPHVIDDLLLDHAFGAELRRAAAIPLAPAVALAEIAKAPRATALVPPGGSSALGTIGHIEGALELAWQVREGLLPEPDALVVAFGTGGTAAGLAFGLALAGLRTRVVAVRVVEAITTRALLRELLNGARRLLARRGAPVSELPRRALERIELDAHELGAGYGHATDAGRAAKEVFGRAGITLETTYTGKAAASLLALARRGTAKRILYWHTFSSVDLAPRLREVSPESLPAAFHPVLRAAGRLR
jgi:1-aminocyclopropane-1-carboxylate deaminase/D-cysteine desulfhydrase-like pyridoxal-dependent ACC family enzyme